MANMDDTHPFLLQLLITRDIAAAPVSTAELMDRYDVSERTVKRHIREARHMGAELVAERHADGYRWRCTNWPAIERNTTRWIELEERRDLRSA